MGEIQGVKFFQLPLKQRKLKLFYTTIQKNIYSPGDSFPNLLNTFILSGNIE